jgi:hypothetical protein
MPGKELPWRVDAIVKFSFVDSNQVVIKAFVRRLGCHKFEYPDKALSLL